MFDPKSDENGARRRSLLSYRKAQMGSANSGRPAPDMTDQFEAALREDQQFDDPASLAERLRAKIAEAQSDDYSDGFDAPDAIDTVPEVEQSGGNQPLIDPLVVLTTAWRSRFFIAFTAILGVALGVMLALSTPHLYVAVSQFVLDPRELRLTDTEFLPQSYSSDSTLALVESQVAIVSSSPVLQAVVTDLNLADDPEFNGTAPGSLGNTFDVLRDLLTGSSDRASDRNSMAVQSLSRVVSASRGERTFIVYVSAETEDPVKSAQIANQVVDEYIKQQRVAQSELYERTAASLNKQLDDLRQDVETAERRVEQYKAENDLVDAGGSLISDTALLQLNQQLAQVRAQKVEIQVRADTARQLNVDALLSGTAPEILQSSTIGELRAEYAGAKRNFDTLTTSLGPRHPSRIAAEQTLATARSEISNELRRIVEATQTELRRVIQSEQQLASDLAVLKSRQVSTSTDLVRLRELEREALATTQIYQSFLKRARETSEQQNLNTSNIRMVSQATPPITSSGPSRQIIVFVGLLIGLLTGLAIVLVLGAFRSLKASAGELFQDDEPHQQMQEESFDPQPSVATVAAEPVAEQTVHPVEDAWDDWDAGPEDDDWQSDDVRGPVDDPEREAQDIRAEIREMRETVERLYNVRKVAREDRRRA